MLAIIQFKTFFVFPSSAVFLSFIILYGVGHLFQFIINFGNYEPYRQFVRFRGSGIDPSQGFYRHTHTHTQNRINAYMHAMSEIQTHGSSFKVIEDSTRLIDGEVTVISASYLKT
jgi:hypothetical protein